MPPWGAGGAGGVARGRRVPAAGFLPAPSRHRGSAPDPAPQTPGALKESGAVQDPPARTTPLISPV
ncbi:hypothetical protein F2B00_33355, partial [Streptomyces parvus]